jgi:hypothetical protein
MIISILNHDNRVTINGEVLEMPVTGLDDDVIAIHWYETHGYMEKESAANLHEDNLINDTSMFQHLVDQFYAIKSESMSLGTWQDKINVLENHGSILYDHMQNILDQLWELKNG